MKITVSQQNEKCVLQIEGRVDTNTSPQLQEAILESFQNSRYVVLDFEKVDYISSAGLRALLIGQKTATSKSALMELIRVGPSVMSVLKSVGFVQILNIRQS